MNRIAILAGVVLALVLVNTGTVFAGDPPGANLYSTYCAACHGKEGKGGLAPAIGDPAYLKTHDDAALTQTTANGITAGGMPAWSKAKGGMLTDDQISAIVAYLRGAPPETATTPPPAASAVPQVYIETKLALKQNTDYDGNPVLIALLTDYEGYPVNGATIAFTRKTAFGMQDLGTVKTDVAGFAPLTVPGLTTGSQVAAEFKGAQAWDASAGKMVLAPPQLAVSGSINPAHVSLSLDEPLLAPEGSLITPYPPLLPATLFLLVVLGVWILYGYVFSQIVGIRKDGEVVSKENTLRFKRR